MRTSRITIGLAALAVVLLAGAVTRILAQPPTAGAPPATAPTTQPGKLPHIEVDVKAKTVRVECEAVNAEMPLEFFCCMNNTAEHETVLRSPALPSHIHLALVMLGLEPGKPVYFSPATERWIPPQGPPLQITVEYAGKDGKTVSVPAYRMMRNVKSKREMPPMTWVFTGSKILDDGKYAADVTGYTVTVVNFELSLIDIPEIVSSDNESLEWEANPDVLPKRGQTVWMVIEPAGKNDVKAPVPAPAGNQPGANGAVQLDEARMKVLRQRWEKAVTPHRVALAEAAQTHYQVINALREEQQRLIDEADRVQRVIDELQKEYQEMTTPRPGKAASGVSE